VVTPPRIARGDRDPPVISHASATQEVVRPRVTT
jgi:hypothetical protein